MFWSYQFINMYFWPSQYIAVFIADRYANPNRGCKGVFQPPWSSAKILTTPWFKVIFWPTKVLQSDRGFPDFYKGCHLMQVFMYNLGSTGKRNLHTEKRNLQMRHSLFLNGTFINIEIHMTFYRRKWECLTVFFFLRLHTSAGLEIFEVYNWIWPNSNIIDRSENCLTSL